jgi:hypothetical protein
MHGTGNRKPDLIAPITRKPCMKTSHMLRALSVGVALPTAALAGTEPFTCTLQYWSYGDERRMRLNFSDETTAVLEFLTGQGTWQEDPDLGPLSCEVENTCRGHSAKDAAAKGGTPVGVTVALDRGAGYAAYAEWRVVNEEILQWAFLTRLTCD